VVRVLSGSEIVRKGKSIPDDSAALDSVWLKPLAKAVTSAVCDFSSL